MTADDLSEIENILITVTSYFEWLEIAVVFVCAFILFGYHRKLKKPTFVLVMWSLFIVQQVA